MPEPQPPRDPAGVISWCRDRSRADEVAHFFVAHVTAAYISHSELQFGRATAPDRWSADLHARIAGEVRRAIDRAAESDGASGTRLALLEDEHGIAGLAFVSWSPDAAGAFATIEDLLVDTSKHGNGRGGAMLAWIEDACRAVGIGRLFLESGQNNGRAHRFFEKRGFAQTSIVMMKQL